MRVVSLVPSITETLRSWGLDPVACTRFCEQPDLPTVGGTKDPDVAAIAALAPDLVVLDDEENRREDADALAAAGLALHVTHVRRVTDVGPVLAALAGAVDRPFDPDAFARRLPPPAVAARLAFVPIWRRPWMTLSPDTYGASLLAHLGVATLGAGSADRYPELSLEAAAARSPDLVLAPSEPYPFGPRHVEELRVVAPDVRLVDGRDLFWWGVRTPHALERLAQVLATMPT